MKVWWDIENRKLLSSSGSLQLMTSIQWVARDVVAVTLYTGAVNASNVWEAADPAGGALPTFAAKVKGKLGATALMVFQGIWTHTATGTWSGLIDLRTAALLTEVDVGTVELTGEFVLVDEAGVNSASTQIDIQVVPDVYRGTETYGEAVAVNTSIAREELRDGKKVVVLRNSDGAVVAEFGVPGEEVL